MEQGSSDQLDLPWLQFITALRDGSARLLEEANRLRNSISDLLKGAGALALSDPDDDNSSGRRRVADSLKVDQASWFEA
ncbi:MAG: hypothetical protein ACO3YU_10885, partial [Candidatus Nanopelagicales bacterium]